MYRWWFNTASAIHYQLTQIHWIFQFVTYIGLIELIEGKFCHSGQLSDYHRNIGMLALVGASFPHSLLNPSLIFKSSPYWKTSHSFLEIFSIFTVHRFQNLTNLNICIILQSVGSVLIYL